MKKLHTLIVSQGFHNALRKAVFLGLIAFVLAFSSCSNSGDESGSSPFYPPQSSDVFKNQLSSLPNVSGVTKFDMDSIRSRVREELKEKLYKGNIYKFYVTSKLNPGDPDDTRTFNQKVIVGFSGYDKPNCLMTTGYYLRDEATMIPTEHEIAFLLNGNFVAVEHRYFGESQPIGMNRSDGNYDGTYWQYLSTSNAAYDVHQIVTQMKTLLKGKWVASGGSKGGLTANLYCYYYPEDVDLTVPYVAPLCNGVNDQRFFDYIYNTAGEADLRYQNGKAAEYRALLLEAQLWFLERRDEIYKEDKEGNKTYKEELFKIFVDDAKKTETYYREDLMTPDILYDMQTINFPIGFWQYEDEKKFLNLKEVMALAEDNTEYTTADGKTVTKKDWMFDNLKSDLTTDSKEMDITPYVVQSLIELGNYAADANPLRKAIEEHRKSHPGCKARITMPPEEDETAVIKYTFSDAEQALFKYDNTTRNALINWSQTTDEQVIMIYGISDPWYYVRIPDVKRENIHIFVHPKNNHYAKISNFPEPQKTELMELLNQYLY